MRDWKVQFHAYNAQEQSLIIQFIIKLLREILHDQIGGDQLSRLNMNQKNEINRRTYLNSLSLAQIENISHVLSEALYGLERNGHAKTIMYNSCLKIESVINQYV